MTSPLLSDTGVGPSQVPASSLAALLARWLPRQRWFTGQGRDISGVSVVAATALTADCYHLLVRVDQRGSSGGDHYQVLLGVAAQMPPRMSPSLIGEVEARAGERLMIYDAVHDHRAAIVLLERLRRGGTAGHLRFESLPRTAVPCGLTPRVLDVEQSNTSIVYGDELILKLFRHIQPGINPDLEVTGALARHGFTQVPAPIGWFQTEAPFWSTLGMVQPFLTDSTDGWALALESGRRRQGFTDEAHELGRTTGELHVALARAFPTDVGPVDQPARMADAMSHRLLRAAARVPALRPYVPDLQEIYAAVVTAGGERPLQRTHGDLHLGQVLHAHGRWHIVDFEGEPAKPVPERRSLRSPIADVAGMLRSFDYAAQSGPEFHPQWGEGCRNAFCAGYGESGGFDPRAVPAALRAHEADRAVYEVVYESVYRPDLMAVPMQAVARLCATRGTHPSASSVIAAPSAPPAVSGSSDRPAQET
ncbi:maltokinase [Streptomyces sp. NPDC102406]|uniref:maltokinase N-terminal cap-like domain-containing protein n=1 Tax=Streptomyces sp. NPDC102406 TaxID=3366171 RepID=UPI00381C4F7C